MDGRPRCARALVRRHCPEPGEVWVFGREQNAELGKTLLWVERVDESRRSPVSRPARPGDDEQAHVRGVVRARLCGMFRAVSRPQAEIRHQLKTPIYNRRLPGSAFCTGIVSSIPPRKQTVSIRRARARLRNTNTKESRNAEYHRTSPRPSCYPGASLSRLPRS